LFVSIAQIYKSVNALESKTRPVILVRHHCRGYFGVSFQIRSDFREQFWIARGSLFKIGKSAFNWFVQRLVKKSSSPGPSLGGSHRLRSLPQLGSQPSLAEFPVEPDCLNRDSKDLTDFCFRTAPKESQLNDFRPALIFQGQST
jgi:hypothetical protein